MPPSEGSTGTSQSLERGLAILSSFNSDRPLIGVSELSRELDLSRSTAHRYIATLAQLGYLQQDPRLEALPARPEGARPRLLGDQLDGPARDLRAAPAAAQRRDAATPSTSRSSTAPTSSTSSAAARPGPGQREIDLNLHVGARLPAYCTAMGKAILAFLPEDRREEIIERIDFAPRGPNTLTDPDAFREELARIRGVGRRGERRGARLRAAVDRRADPLALGRGRRGAQPRRPPHDGVDGRADRALRPRGHADGARHLARAWGTGWRPVMAAGPRRAARPLDAAAGRSGDDRDRALPRLARARARARVRRTTTSCGAGRSTTSPAFWSSIWDFFEVKAHAPYSDRRSRPTRCRARPGSRARG